MPVIINDFEIITEPPKAQENAAPAAQNLPAAPAAQNLPAATLRPEDIQRIQRHYEARKMRLVAD